MTMLWQTLLALAGCIGGAYIGEELIDGGAIAWTVTGGIIALCGAPLFKTLMASRLA